MTAAIEVLEVRRFDGHGNLKALAKVKIGCTVAGSRWSRLPAAASSTSCAELYSMRGDAGRIDHCAASSRRAGNRPGTDPATMETSRER
jgi:hypothetical protein